MDYYIAVVEVYLEWRKIHFIASVWTFRNAFLLWKVPQISVLSFNDILHETRTQLPFAAIFLCDMRRLGP